MPDTSTILSLPMILPSQAQKHVTHNEALRLLDVMVQLAVKDRNLTAPPGSPSQGDRYIVPVGATGAWAGKTNKVALYETGVWQFFTPLIGWQAWITDEATVAGFDGLAWVATADGPLTVGTLGISATANATNRLSVSSPATLLNHAGAGHQLKINKATVTDAASLLFQTGFSGRAEMGTVGSDDFGVKVSADGSAFFDAIAVASASGIVSLPQGVFSGSFTLRDTADPSKRAVFSLASIPTATTRSYTFPASSTEIAGLAGTQTFSGSKTFSAPLIVSATAATLGSATTTSTYGVGSGATVSGNSKTVNIGTDGVAGSTSVINIGSAVIGAGGTTVVNTPTVTFASSVASVAMTDAVLVAKYLGLGGAVGDATNRLSLNAPAVLLNHAGAGHQVKVNKATAADTASLSFQTGFSGRAEMGTTGSDDFAIKVSPDGSAYFTAITVARTDGVVTLPAAMRLGGQASDPVSPVNGAVWLNTTSGQVKVRSAGVTQVIGASGGGAVTDGDKGDVIVSGGGTVWTLDASAKYGVQVALNQQVFFN